MSAISTTLLNCYPINYYHHSARAEIVLILILVQTESQDMILGFRENYPFFNQLIVR